MQSLTGSWQYNWISRTIEWTSGQVPLRWAIGRYVITVAFKGAYTIYSIVICVVPVRQPVDRPNQVAQIAVQIEIDNSATGRKWQWRHGDDDLAYSVGISHAYRPESPITAADKAVRRKNKKIAKNRHSDSRKSCHRCFSCCCSLFLFLFLAIVLPHHRISIAV